MNKEITISRTWQLVQYEPFTVTDTITEIPDHIASNPEAMQLLRYLQLVDIEWAYVRYHKLKLGTPKLSSVESISEAQEYLEQERRTTFEGLFKVIKDHNEKIESDLQAKREEEKKYLSHLGQEVKTINVSSKGE